PERPRAPGRSGRSRTPADAIPPPSGSLPNRPHLGNMGPNVRTAKGGRQGRTPRPDAKGEPLSGRLLGASAGRAGGGGGDRVGGSDRLVPGQPGMRHS